MDPIDSANIFAIILCTPIAIVLIILVVITIKNMCCGANPALVYPNEQYQDKISISTRELGKDCYIIINPQSEQESTTIAIVDQ